VTCTPVVQQSDIVPEPVAVFEITFGFTAVADRVAEKAEYRATPSIQRYVMLEQPSVASVVFERAGEYWIGRPLAGDAGNWRTLALAEVGLPEGRIPQSGGGRVAALRFPDRTALAWTGNPPIYSPHER